MWMPKLVEAASPRPIFKPYLQVAPTSHRQRMARILDMPVEILQDIGGQLSHTDQARLRAACTYLGEAMASLFFARFVLYVNRILSKDGQLVLRQISRGDSGWAKWARTLTIISAEDERDGALLSNLADTAMRDLSIALTSMANVGTLIWTVKETDPAWLRTAIWGCFRRLPLLEDLQLQVHGSVPFALLGLQNLRRLEVATSLWPPARQRFQARYFQKLAASAKPEVEAAQAQQAARQLSPLSMAQQIANTVTESRRLSSLHLFGSKELSAVWTILRRDTVGVRLSEIATAMHLVSREFLEYLGSYSGVQKLHILKPDVGVARNDVDSHNLADVFYDTVLCKHAGTMLEFCCTVGFTSRWCFSSHNIGVISRLRNLQRLEMGLAAEKSTDDVVLFFDTFMGLPKLNCVAIHSAKPLICAWSSSGHFQVANKAREATRQAAEICRLNWVSTDVVINEHNRFHPDPATSETHDNRSMRYDGSFKLPFIYWELGKPAWAGRICREEHRR
ncbi:hypothetical protein GGX14DRAFT_540879 [Mycena pura]|uniref:F-box domain-containing protein n=1 Tax=Mycena pura TaxID=153505 RepID=A0AAD6VS22_9AGAR|nr:hypothetical protein GGX14DRAFT_540879 [Mycena pura]